MREAARDDTLTADARQSDSEAAPPRQHQAGRGGAFVSGHVTTYAEQLDSVQALIASIEASPNASVTVANRTFTKHDLQTLYEREQWLRTMAARETRGGRRIQRVVPL